LLILLRIPAGRSRSKYAVEEGKIEGNSAYNVTRPVKKVRVTGSPHIDERKIGLVPEQPGGALSEKSQEFKERRGEALRLA